MRSAALLGVQMGRVYSWLKVLLLFHREYSSGITVLASTCYHHFFNHFIQYQETVFESYSTKDNPIKTKTKNLIPTFSDRHISELPSYCADYFREL